MQREFERWKEMIASVDDPSSPRWQWHGRHGVILDPRWYHFEYFIQDVGLMPGSNSQLDREPGSDMFSKETTCWRKGVERTLTNVQGITRTVSEWSAKLNIPKGTIDTRIRKNLPINLVLAPGKLSIRRLTGRRYGMLTVIDRGKVNQQLILWKCKCDCGSTLQLATQLLLTQKVLSCGCIPSKQVKLCPNRLYHNGKNRLLQEWSRITGVPVKQIQSRIRSGYTVDQALGYDPIPERLVGTRQLSLVSGVKESTIRHRKQIGIRPENLIQVNNVDRAKLYEFNNLTMTLGQWAVYLNIKESTLRSRLYRGWCIEKVLSNE